MILINFSLGFFIYNKNLYYMNIRTIFLIRTKLFYNKDCML